MFSTGKNYKVKKDIGEGGFILRIELDDVRLKEIEEKNHSSLHLILEDIQKVVEKRRRQIYSIEVNEEQLIDFENLRVDEIETLEVDTIPMEKVVLNVLKEIEPFIKSVENDILSLAFGDGISEDMTAEEYIKIERSKEAIKWLYNVLELVKENTLIDFEFEELNKEIGQLTRLIKLFDEDINRAFKPNIYDLLNRIKKSSKKYHNYLLEEQLKGIKKI